MLWSLLIWLLLLGLSAELMAVEQSSISQKLQQLQHVSKADRFKLINAIKRDMVKLNNQQRIATFGKLRIMIDKRKKRSTNQAKHQQKHKHKRKIRQ